MTKQNRLFHCKNTRSLRTTVGSAKGLPFLANNTTCNKTIRENYHIPHLDLSPPTTVSQLSLGFEAYFYHFRSKAGTGYPKDHLLFLIMIVTVIKDITFPHKSFTLVPPWECFFLHVVGLTTLDLKFLKLNIYPEQ